MSVAAGVMIGASVVKLGIGLASAGVTVRGIAKARVRAFEDAESQRADLVRQLKYDTQRITGQAALDAGNVGAAVGASGLTGGQAGAVREGSVMMKAARDKSQAAFETKVSLLDVDRDLEVVMEQLDQQRRQAWLSAFGGAAGDVGDVAIRSRDVRSARRTGKE